MKRKLNLTIDKALIPLSKRYARKQGKSVSELVESLLRELVFQDAPTFSEKWKGRFRANAKEGPRYDKLKDRYQL